jgi:hypothetical protein
MWEALVNYKTKRGHANYLLVMSKLYNDKHEAGKDVEKWFLEMKRLRRQLNDFNQPMADAQFAQVLQIGLSDTHRELIRHFETQVRLGHQAPTSNEVINAVLIDRETNNGKYKAKKNGSNRILYAGKKKKFRKCDLNPKDHVIFATKQVIGNVIAH